MRDPEFVKKAEKIVMEYGPSPIRKIAESIDYEGQRPGRALERSKNLFYMGNGRSGVWYLEHQVQDAKNQYLSICEDVKKRKEEQRHQPFYLPVNTGIHSFLTLFRTNGDKYTAKQFWNIVGGNLMEVRRHLTSLQEGGLLFAEGRPRVFRRNPEFASICGDAAEEIFEKRFNSYK